MSISYTEFTDFLNKEHPAKSMMTIEDDSGIVRQSDIEQSGYGSVQDSQEAATEKHTTKRSFFKMDRDKKIILTLMLTTRLLFGIYTVFMIPFFPTVGEAKGLSSAATGFVLSCWDLFVVIFAPVVGALYTKLGPKVLFIGGLFLSALSNIVFPLVEYSPPGACYVAACVVIRMFGGLSGAAYKTSAYATLAKIFPENVASMFATMEVFSCIGFMIGPVLGGGLYEAGGFYLPFIAVGGALGAFGLLSMYCLPPLSGSDDDNPENSPSFIPLLRQPLVMIIAFLIVSLGLSTTFMDLSVTLHFADTFHLTPSVIGLVSIIFYVTLFSLHPLWGILADKLPNQNLQLLCFAFLVMGVSMTFNGPAPFLHIKQHLWLNIVCQCIYFAGPGSITILFRTLNTVARNLGHKEQSSEGMVSSLYTLLFSFGAFFGPFLGGALLDAIGFAWSFFAFACLKFLGAVMLIVYIVTTPTKKPAERERHISETQPILYTKLSPYGNEESFDADEDISDKTRMLKQSIDTD